MPQTPGSTAKLAERLQANLTLVRGSALHARIREAEQLTGRTPTQIVRAVVEHHLETWLREEAERLRRRGETEVSGIRVVDQGALRPRYRADEGPDPEYAEAAALRVPVVVPSAITHRNPPVVEVEHRPRFRSWPDESAADS